MTSPEGWARKSQKRTTDSAPAASGASVVLCLLRPARRRRIPLVRLMLEVHRTAETEKDGSCEGHGRPSCITAPYLDPSDSSMWYMDSSIIHCIGNVRLIQGETELTSEKPDYLINDDLAQFRGAIVQLRNKQENILRTKPSTTTPRTASRVHGRSVDEERERTDNRE